MPIDYLVSALVTLAVVVDPVGLVPTFLAVTHGLPQQARPRIAVRASIIAAALLAGTALVGDWLPGSGFQPDHRPALEFYMNNPDTDPERKYRVEICLPVKPL